MPTPMHRPSLRQTTARSDRAGEMGTPSRRARTPRAAVSGDAAADRSVQGLQQEAFFSSAEQLPDATAHQPPLAHTMRRALSVLLQVRAGTSLASLWAQMPTLPSGARAPVQALVMQALRQRGRAWALAERLAARAPAAPVHELLLLALACLQGDAQEDSDAVGNAKEGAADARPTTATASVPLQALSARALPYAPHTLVDQAVEACRQERRTAAAAGFLNACLRRYVREHAALDADIEPQTLARWNHPVWWVERLKKDHPEQAEAVLRAAQSPAPLTLRVQQSRIGVAAYGQALAAAGWVAEVAGPAAWLLRHAPSVSSLPGYREGWFAVQDAAAQCAAPLLLDGLDLQEPLRILDACAAPGGKTAHLLDLAPHAHVTALDIDAERLKRVQDNLKRLVDRPHERVRLLPADAAQPSQWWDGVAFDAILLDAPCTASGIVRRHPDVRWLRRESDVVQLAQIQQQLLQGLWPLVRAGGRLLYCTCSVFKAEGLDQLQAFLERHTDAFLLPSPLHLLPHNQTQAMHTSSRVVMQPSTPAPGLRSDHDGFFYALLEKSAA